MKTRKFVVAAPVVAAIIVVLTCLKYEGIRAAACLTLGIIADVILLWASGLVLKKSGTFYREQDGLFHLCEEDKIGFVPVKFVNKNPTAFLGLSIPPHRGRHVECFSSKNCCGGPYHKEAKNHGGKTVWVEGGLFLQPYAKKVYCAPTEALFNECFSNFLAYIDDAAGSESIFECLRTAYETAYAWGYQLSATVAYYEIPPLEENKAYVRDCPHFKVSTDGAFSYEDRYAEVVVNNGDWGINPYVRWKESPQEIDLPEPIELWRLSQP